MQKKFSDERMEVKLSALLGNYDKQTDRPRDRPTIQPTGRQGQRKFHFQYVVVLGGI